MTEHNSTAGRDQHRASVTSATAVLSRASAEAVLSHTGIFSNRGLQKETIGRRLVAVLSALSDASRRTAHIGTYSPQDRK